MPSVSGSLDDPQMLSEAHRRMERMRMEDAVSPMMDSASSGGEGAGSLSGAPTGGSSGPRRRKDGGLGGSKKSRGRASPAALSTSTNASTHAASTSYCENRYFILKSLNEEDLKLSVQFGIWATQSHLVPILNDAFESGEFFGYAKMADSISQEKEQAIEHAREGQTWEPSIEFPISPELRAAALEEIEQAAKEGHLTFNEAEIIGRASTTTKSWGIEFLIEWIEVHKVPFTKTSHLLNPLYEDREVKVSKDGTEVDPAVGEQLVALFKKPGNRDRSRKAGRSQLAEGSTSSSSTTGCTGDDAATTISVSNSEAGEQEGDGEGHPSRRPSLAAVHSAASSANVEQTATSDRASPQPPHQLNQSLMPSRGLSSRRSSVLSAKSTSSGSGMAAERRPSTDPGSIKQGASGGGSGAKYGHQQHQSKGYHGAGGSNGGDGYRSGPRHQSYHSPSGSSSSTGPAYGQEGIAGQQPSYGDQHRPGWYKSNYRGNSGTPMMAAGSPIPGQGSPSVGGGSGDYYQPSQHRKGGGGGKYGPSSSSSGMGYDSSSQFQQQHNLRRNYGAHPHGNHHMGGNVGGNYRSGGNGPSHSQTTTPSVPSGSGPVTAADSLQSGSSTNRGSSQEHRFGNSGGNYGSKSGPLSTSALSTSNTGTTTSQSPTGSSGAGAAALTPQQQHSSMYGQAPPPGVAYTFMPQHAAAAAHAAAMQGYHQVMSPYMTYPYMPGPNPYLHGMGWVPTAGATAGQGPPPPMGGMMAGHPPPIPHHGQHGFQPQQHGFQQHGFQIPYPPGAHPHPQPGPYQLGVSNAGGNLPVLASGAGIESAGTTATGVGAGVSSQGAAGGQEMMMMTMMPMGGMVPLFGYDGIPYAYISAEEAYHQSMQAYGYGYMQPMEETAPDVEGDGEADYGEGQVQLEDEGAAEGDYMPQGDKHLEIDHGHELEGDLMESEIRSIQDQQHSADHSHLLLQRQQLNNSSLASSTLSSSSTLIPPGLSSVGKVHESAMDEYDDDENRWEEDLAAKGVVPQEYRSPVLRKESEVEGSAQPGAVSGGNDVEGKERQKQQQQQQVLQQQQQKSRPGSRHQQRQKQHQQKRASLSRTRNGPGEDEDESPRGEMGGSGMATTLTTPTAVAS
ncbi:hypothetical protein BGW38_005081 [Lunasporangiospora selenospora]|uniref:YTH domain-containing protein n=1 Tax=Lunasporangiospora selenospora TaxID=979761 RepID=A0A9P6FQF8_9FUNG|nr:hypothetical protein BGW38_005081 [Lunasporangiospora selenospora]